MPAPALKEVTVGLSKRLVTPSGQLFQIPAVMCVICGYTTIVEARLSSRANQLSIQCKYVVILPTQPPRSSSKNVSPVNSVLSTTVCGACQAT